MTRTRRATLAVLLALAPVALAACGGERGEGSKPDGGKPSIVVTYSILGAIVGELVGDQADVTVVMPDGVDPHEYQASAKDVESMTKADLVVENGLDLEEGLLGALQEARDAGVPTFTASDHINVRTVGEGEAAEPDDPDQQPGAKDPHLWLDPISMEEIVEALGPIIGERLGLDVADRASELQRKLEELNAQGADRLSVVPSESRKLVTGHESMGYFARRYDFELLGALIPSLSSAAEVSASELAGLKRTIEEEHVPAIFTELGTPKQVADAIGEETGVRVVEIATHGLPEDGSYFTFMKDVCDRVANGLQ